MDVIIVGAGQAGTHIAQALTQEKHNVTLVDLDRQRLDRAEEFLDVRTICDHGASPWLLSLCMVLGRLELFAILVLFVPSFWRGR
jgi:Trk K+ transport system NAD-binding subunit